MCDWDMFLLSVTVECDRAHLIHLSPANHRLWRQYHSPRHKVVTVNRGTVRVTLAPPPSRFKSRSYTLIIPNTIPHYSFIGTIDLIYDSSSI